MERWITRFQVVRRRFARQWANFSKTRRHCETEDKMTEWRYWCDNRLHKATEAASNLQNPNLEVTK